MFPLYIQTQRLRDLVDRHSELDRMVICEFNFKFAALIIIKLTWFCWSKCQQHAVVCSSQSSSDTLCPMFKFSWITSPGLEHTTTTIDKIKLLEKFLSSLFFFSICKKPQPWYDYEEVGKLWNQTIKIFINIIITIFSSKSIYTHMSMSLTSSNPLSKRNKAENYSAYLSF